MKTEKPNPQKSIGRLEFENSYIVLETGPAGVLARIERDDRIEYAGPLPDGTLAALQEAAQ